MKEIRHVIIPNLSEYLRIAEKRAIAPFIKGSKKKIPKKYQNNNYKWNMKGYLVDSRGIVVPSNPIVVGTPRDWRINGQDIYNQKIKHSARGGIMSKLHGIFDPITAGIETISENEFPLSLRLNFYTVDHNKQADRERNIDNDNKWIYLKVVRDSLVKTGAIPDDNPYIINEDIMKTIFIEDEKDSKLEIIIYGRD